MSDLAEAQKISRTSPLAGLFYLVGKKVLTLVEYVGGLTTLGVKTIASVGKNFVGLRDTAQQFEVIGIKSSSLTNLIAIFTGMVLAVQFIVGL